MSTTNKASQSYSLISNLYAQVKTNLQHWGLFFMSLFLFSTTALGQNTWLGTLSPDWDEPGNWSLGHVPTSAENVGISGNRPYDPIIYCGTLAEVRSIIVSDTLTIQKQATLDVYGPLPSSNSFGMRVNSHVLNQGNLYFGDHGRINNTALMVFGSFINDRGLIRIDSTINSGSGTIQLRNTNASFINQNQARIHIGQSGFENGIYGIDLASTNGPQSFINDNSTIIIDNIDRSAIRNTASFINRNGAQLLLGTQGSIENGIGLENNVGLAHSISNDNSTIIIGPYSNQGMILTNASSFENKNGALLHLVTETNASFPFKSFLISGTSGTLLNDVCSTIELNTRYRNNSTRTFTNNGLFIINTSYASIDNGTFINNGVLVDQKGSMQPFTNNEILLEPTSTSNCYNYSPNFSLAASLDYSVDGIFTDTYATNSAGTYTAATNNFSPTDVFEDSVLLYVKVSNASGCTLILPWKVTFTSLCCEGVANCYRDNDGDGFGDPNVPQNMCITCANGFVSNSNDCNDYNGSVNPNAPEVCNGMDDDCDGDIDINNVVDNDPPTALCNDLSISLDPNNQALISDKDIDNCSSDACGIASYSLSQSLFDCNQIGSNLVVLTVTDVNGNTASCQSTVSVLDMSPPQAVCQDITLSLDVNGYVDIVPSDVDGGSSDNCGLPYEAVSPNAFSCNEVGPNTVTLTVRTPQNDEAQCTAQVMIENSNAPQASCQGATVSLDFLGQASVALSDIDGGSSDACGITSTTLSPSTFDCNSVGANTVSLTVSNAENLSDQCTTTVIVQNTFAPFAECRALTLSLDTDGTLSIAPSDVDDLSFDVCGITSMQVSPSTFGCNDIGRNDVILTLRNAANLTSSCTTRVTVEQNIPPEAVCQDITISLDAVGNANILASDIDAGSSDICGITNMTVSPNTFGCQQVGSNVVSLTVDNDLEQSDNCTAQVTVENNNAPEAICQDITVSLVAFATTSITASDIDAGSSDICGITSRLASTTTFGCDDVGQNTVTLRVQNAAGLSDNCTARVSIVNNNPPEAFCTDATISIDPHGVATVDPAELDGASADPCGITGISASPSTFGCNQIGQQVVTLTLSNAANLSDACTATVTVVNTHAPEAVCQDITISLDAFGNASISASQVDNGSSDICGITGSSVSPNTFGCNQVGQNTVTLTVDNIENLSDFCNANVTVENNNAPTAICQDITISLDANGNASIMASDVDGGSSDICGIQSLSVSPSIFSCTEVGNNTTRLTVQNLANLTDDCNAQVTVQNPNPPTASCQSITVALSEGGFGFISSTSVDNGSSSLCSSVSVIVSKTVFSCEDLGNTTVTLTVTDLGNGLTSSCTATVTVTDPDAWCCQAPVALCANPTLSLDPNGNTSLAISDVRGSSSADCGLDSENISNNSFTCADIGSQMVTYTITDINGASASCQAAVQIEDNQIPVLSLLGDNPLVLCEGDALIDQGATITDNCDSGTISGNTGNVNSNQAGTYSITYNYADPGGNPAVQITRTVIVNPTPNQLAQQGCGSCGQIRLNLCQFDQAPDLDNYFMANSQYENGATLNWYVDNNGSQGTLLGQTPQVNTAQTGNTYYWVSQQLGDCEGSAIRVRTRVRTLFTPDFNLPAIGCMGGQVDLSDWVSDPSNRATAYTFYDADPASGASPIGSVSATAGVVDFGQQLIINISNGNQTYWVQSTVPNGCGGIASSSLQANSLYATLDPINNHTVNHGDPVLLNFPSQNATYTVWADHYSFNNPNIGLIGSSGLGSLSFTASNTSGQPVTAMIRVIAYNGNCAGQIRDFYITVNSGPASRLIGNYLNLQANQVKAQEVALDWIIQYDQELVRFEVEQQLASGEFKSIGQVNWIGNGDYQFHAAIGDGQKYVYRLKMIHTDGRAIWSREVVVNCGDYESDPFTLYPNPTTGRFSMKVAGLLEGEWHYQISDQFGQIIQLDQLKGTKVSFDISGQPAGHYYLMITSPEGERYVKKIVKY